MGGVLMLIIIKCAFFIVISTYTGIYIFRSRGKPLGKPLGKNFSFFAIFLINLVIYV